MIQLCSLTAEVFNGSQGSLFLSFRLIFSTTTNQISRYFQFSALKVYFTNIMIFSDLILNNREDLQDRSS